MLRLHLSPLKEKGDTKKIYEFINKIGFKKIVFQLYQHKGLVICAATTPDEITLFLVFQ